MKCHFIASQVLFFPISFLASLIFICLSGPISLLASLISILARSYFFPCQPDISLFVRFYFFASQSNISFLARSYFFPSSAICNLVSGFPQLSPVFWFQETWETQNGNIYYK